MKAEQHQKNEHLWQQRIDNWRQSGLSQTQWCEQNHIAPHQLYYWRRKLAPSSKLVPLAITEAAPSQPSTLRFTVNNVQVEASAKQAAALIHALQAYS